MFELNQYLSFAVHGAQGKHGEGVAGSVEQLLAFLETLTTKAPADIFATLMPGIASMTNVHPLLVHFPIACLTLFFVTDLVGSVFRSPSWRQGAGWFLYAGTLLAAATVAAGLAAAASVPHGDNVHDIMEQHEHLGIAVLALSATLSLWRFLARGVISGGANALYLILALILQAMVIFTADLGGFMVYKFGVAVEATERQMQDAHHEHQHEH